MPQVEVRPRRVGGSTYQVPVRSACRPQGRAGHSLAGRRRPTPQWQDDDRALVRRTAGMPPTTTGAAVRQREEKHKDGRREQGVLALPLVVENGSVRLPQLKLNRLGAPSEPFQAVEVEVKARSDNPMG